MRSDAKSRTPLEPWSGTILPADVHWVYRDFWKAPGQSGAICGMSECLQNPGYIKRRIKVFAKEAVFNGLFQCGDKVPHCVNEE